jgi:hypothetical protein
MVRAPFQDALDHQSFFSFTLAFTPDSGLFSEA